MIGLNQSEFEKLLHELGHVFFALCWIRGGEAGFSQPKIAKNKNKSQACKEFVEFIHIGITYVKKLKKKQVKFI